MRWDYGDAPDSYGTTLGASGPSHVITSGIMMGANIDDESDGVPSSDASGDDSAGTPDDEDGVTFPDGVVISSSSDFCANVLVTSPSAATLIGWVDFDKNGTFDADEAQIISGASLEIDGSTANKLTWTIPGDLATGGQTYARFRLSTDPLLTVNTPGGAVSDGEVEDYVLTLPTYDYGDLPEGGAKDFPTAGSNAGDRARHELGSGLVLGSSVDSEDDGQPSVGADGDGADEDGFPYLPDLMPGQTYFVPFIATVPGTVTDPVYLNAWIDYNCSGTFEAGEQIADDLVVTDGANTVTFTVPADAAPGTAYARFRLSTEAGLGASGDAPDGEVEDYVTKVLRPEGAIGNYVWLDENSDGSQDPGEPGIPNVTVVLYLDADGAGGNAPVEVSRAQTDTQGGYLFTGLAPGCYYVDVVDASLPSNYSQTTTYTKVIDGPDADATTDDGDYGNNGSAGTREAPIAGVRVELCDNSGNTIATAVTDSAGQYLFNNLPAGTYTVKVDTGTLPDGVSPVSTYESDAGSDSQTTATITTADILTEDFSYPPLGGIGDTVFFDSNDNDTPDAGEGLEGVTVKLCDDSGNELASTVTDSNGYYFFGDLPAGTYNVKVDTATLPPGLLNTEDPDTDPDTLASPGDSESEVTIGVGETNPDQDFGYQGNAGRIGNLVWLDLDADGVYDGPAAGETPIGGVTIDLYLDEDGNGTRDPGEAFLGITTTAAALNGSLGTDGNYCFENLPAGDYIVEVSDRDGILNGYWHSLGTTDANNNSQEEAFSLELTSGDQKNADFGYYLDPGKLGNYVWLDTDRDGIQDSDEDGFDQVKLTLTITYPNSDVVTLSTLTGDDPSTAGVEQGWYAFCNLLLDEDYRGAGGGSEPTYAITITEPLGYESTKPNEGSEDLEDSDLSGVSAQPVQGSLDVAQNSDPTAEDEIASYDFGLVVVKVDGFDDWVTENGLTGVNALPSPSAGNPTGGNPDGDLYTNLVEYAFCLDPNLGIGVAYCLEPRLTSGYDLIFHRRLGSLSDITYCVLYVDELENSPGSWVEYDLESLPVGVTKTVTPDANGISETVTLENIEALGTAGAKSGFFMLAVKMDCNNDNTDDVISYTDVQGFRRTTIEQNECETYAVPFLTKPVFSGKVEGTSGSDLVFGTTTNVGVDFTPGASGPILETGISYYVEVLSGDLKGHRFDIATGGLETVTLAFDDDLASGPPHSTMLTDSGLPAGFVGAEIMIVQHTTLDEIAPAGAFSGGSSATNGDNVLVPVTLPDGSETWNRYYLLDVADPGDDYWVETGVADRGGDVIPPCQGFFVHPKQGPVTLESYGMVRENSFACPLCEGFTLLAPGYPVAHSPDDLGLVAPAFYGSGDQSASDQLLVWNRDGESPTDTDGYCGYWFVDNGKSGVDQIQRWAKIGDLSLTDQFGNKVLPADRSYFLRKKDDLKDYKVEQPWDNKADFNNGNCD